MTLENAPESASTNRSLGQVATEFLLSLPPEQRLKAHQEINKFVRWYGESRPLGKLTIPEVANYADQISSSATEASEKLGIIKIFLAYAYKQGLTETNLAPHLKTKKASAKATTTKQHPHRKVVLTTQGYADLKAELAVLKNERPRIAQELYKAAADKDFRENAPLEAAREYQGQLEARIRELESILKTATLVDAPNADTHEVSFGDTVVLRDLVSGEEVNYTLVDASEANPLEGKISIASPMGQALLGRTKGQKVEVKAPAGILHYQIEDIKHQ
ncbi:MAG TPA: transcription elongation factor GreA [Dehalococcoidia bacterium]|nr:transcription elongation factor GreA [Dehalococcoidia bacterium]